MLFANMGYRVLLFAQDLETIVTGFLFAVRGKTSELLVVIQYPTE